MKNKLKQLFTSCPSYYNASMEKICLRLNCTVNDVVNFRKTSWYKEGRKIYRNA